jgi:hypothetical protein
MSEEGISGDSQSQLPKPTSQEECPTAVSAKKKPKLVQSHMGMFLDKAKNLRKNTRTGRIETFEVKAGSDLVGDKHQCTYCKRTFSNTQALGNHYNHCKVAVCKKNEQLKKEQLKIASGGGVAQIFGGANVPKQHLQQREKFSSSSSHLVKTITVADREDGRKGNRGSSVRIRYSAQQKYEHLERLEIWQAEQSKKKEKDTLTLYCQLHHPNGIHQMMVNLVKWRQPEEAARIVKAAAEKKYGNLKKLSPTKLRSPFKDMEDILYKEIVLHRKNKRKVSKQRVVISAKKIMTQLDDRCTSKRMHGWTQR